MTYEIGLGLAIHMPLSKGGDPSISFFGQASILDRPFVIRGGNANGSWQFIAQLEGTIDLEPTLEALFATQPNSLRLPRSFPNLTLGNLSFTADPESGDYEAKGQTQLTNVDLFGTTIRDASFDFDLTSKKEAISAFLKCHIETPAVDTLVDIRITPEITVISLNVNQYEFYFANTGKNIFALVRPGAGFIFEDVELVWSKYACSSIPIRPDTSYAAGFTLQTSLLLGKTTLGRLLQIDEPLRLHLDSHELRVEIGTAPSAKKVTLDLNPQNTNDTHSISSFSADSTSEPPTAPTSTTSDDDDLSEATDAQLTITGPISLESILSSVSSPIDNSTTTSTWRKYLGECLEFENLEFSLTTSPEIGVSIVGDATIRIGSWLGISIRKAAFKIIPKELPFSDVSIDASLHSLAVVANFTPILRASADLRYQHDTLGTKVITGSGRVEFFKHIDIGLLVHFEWQHNVFAGGFGFAFAKGLAFGPPAFQLTGIAGGYGYHRTFVMPATPEAVADHSLLRLLRTDSEGVDLADPTSMLAHLRTFAKSLVPRPDAHNLAFGVTFRLMQWVDCVALVLAELGPRPVDLNLLGFADFSFGLASHFLARIQLALSARWNAADNSLRIVGSILKTSWFLHPKCKLHGEFAICMWFNGPQAGDFLVSLGGYSPLVPIKSHYPRLDRVGFTWNIDKRLQLFGQLYFALDRHGLQLGGRAGVKFTSRLLDFDAQFSFDILAAWAPPFFTTVVRVSVQFTLRAITTIRLGLTVDANVHGPPFGAEFFLRIEVGIIKHTFSVRAGSTLNEALHSSKPNLSDVVALAKGGRPNATQMQVRGQSADAQGKPLDEGISSFSNDRHQLIRRYRADNLKLEFSTAIPINSVYREKISDETRHPYPDSNTKIDIRPLGWKDVASDLVWSIEGPTRTETWICIPVMSRCLEALWYIAPNGSSPFQDSNREAVTSIRFEAPIGTFGNVGLGVLPGNRLREGDIDTARTVHAAPRQTSPVPPPKTSSVEERGSKTLESLRVAGFDLEGCTPNVPARMTSRRSRNTLRGVGT